MRRNESHGNIEASDSFIFFNIGKWELDRDEYNKIKFIRNRNRRKYFENDVINELHTCYVLTDIEQFDTINVLAYFIIIFIYTSSEQLIRELTADFCNL